MVTGCHRSQPCCPSSNGDFDYPAASFSQVAMGKSQTSPALLSRPYVGVHSRWRHGVATGKKRPAQKRLCTGVISHLFFPRWGTKDCKLTEFQLGSSPLRDFVRHAFWPSVRCRACVAASAVASSQHGHSFTSWWWRLDEKTLDWFLNGKSAGNHLSCPLLPPWHIYIYTYVSCKCSLQPIHWTKAIRCWFQRWDSFRILCNWWIRWTSPPKMCAFPHGKHWTLVLVYFRCGLTTVTTGPCKSGLHNSSMHLKLCTSMYAHILIMFAR